MIKQRSIFDIDGKAGQIKKLEEISIKPGFWDEQKTAKETMEELNSLKETLENYCNLQSRLVDAEVMNELVVNEDDSELYNELVVEFKDLSREIRKLEIESWFSGEFDKQDAIVTLHAGAGGTESQDWAQMLLRMYTRWAEKRGFKTEVDEFLAGDEAGIKSVTFTVHGRYAFGLLEGEKGVHRLVRISPFDFLGRRHTSFASVDVIPVLDQSIKIDMDPKDLKIETFRATGAGGQHVNKTDSAVRITHILTGIQASCQNERSQAKNKETALLILKARIYEYEKQKRREEIDEIRGNQKEIAWGSQIRSYTFHPYSLVKDHRTGLEKGNVQAIMDGDIEDYIEAYLINKASGELKNG